MNNISPVRIQTAAQQTSQKQAVTNQTKPTVTQKINEKIEKHKTAIAVGVLASIPIAFFAAAIGRNPAKAAKYLKGNPDNISSKAYKKGLEYVEKITNNEQIAKLLNIDVKSFIKDCPKELLPKDSIFYHGTKHSRKIFRHGFTPFASNQLMMNPRELGAAIYLTPDEKVAQNFKALSGKIIPVKVENAKIAIIDDEKYGEIVNKIISFVRDTFIAEVEKESSNNYKMIWSALKNRNKNNAAAEILIQKMFTQAGYDGVYLSKGIVAGNDFLKNNKLLDVNKLFGMNQTQLALFTPEKLTIQSRGFSDRLKDVYKGSVAFIRVQKNSLKNTLDMYKSMLNLN